MPFFNHVSIIYIRVYSIQYTILYHFSVFKPALSLFIMFVKEQIIEYYKIYILNNYGFF